MLRNIITSVDFSFRCHSSLGGSVVFLSCSAGRQENRSLFYSSSFLPLCFLRFSCSYNNNSRDFIVISKTFFIKAVNYKTAFKTGVKNILQGTVIITLLFRLIFNCFAVIAMWCQILFCQCNKAGVLCGEYEYSLINEQFINAAEQFFYI